MSAEEIKSRPSFAGPGQDKDSEFRACAVSDLRVGVYDFKGCFGSGRGVYYGHFGQEFADSPAGGLSGSGEGASYRGEEFKAFRKRSSHDPGETPAGVIRPVRVSD